MDKRAENGTESCAAGPAPRGLLSGLGVKVVPVALFAIGLAFTTLPPATAATATMTSDQAGQYFLSAVCPGRAKAQALDRPVFHGHSYFTGKQMHGKRLRKVRRALKAFRSAEGYGARQLQNPPSAWPSDAAADVARTANALTHETAVIAKLRKKSGKRFLRFWNNTFIPANGVFASASQDARGDLGLPTDPRAGC